MFFLSNPEAREGKLNTDATWIATDFAGIVLVGYFI